MDEREEHHKMRISVRYTYQQTSTIFKSTVIRRGLSLPVGTFNIFPTRGIDEVLCDLYDKFASVQPHLLFYSNMLHLALSRVSLRHEPVVIGGLVDPAVDI